MTEFGQRHAALVPQRPRCVYHPRPGWVVPTMAGLVVLGLAGASGILVATGRRET